MAVQRVARKFNVRHREGWFVVIFYAVLAVIAMALGVWFMRSAMFKQLRRGHGSDPSQLGSRLDHHANQGTSGQRIGDDGSGGTRQSRIQSKHTRRR